LEKFTPKITNSLFLSLAALAYREWPDFNKVLGVFIVDRITFSHFFSKWFLCLDLKESSCPKFCWRVSINAVASDFRFSPDHVHDLIELAAQALLFISPMFFLLPSSTVCSDHVAAGFVNLDILCAFWAKTTSSANLLLRCRFPSRLACFLLLSLVSKDIIASQISCGENIFSRQKWRPISWNI